MVRNTTNAGNSHIVIEDFCGIRSVSAELSKFNIIFGKQAVGKSVMLKLIYYFNTIQFGLSRVLKNHVSYAAFRKAETDRFKKYFPCDSWGSKKMHISYTYPSGLKITIRNTPKSSKDIIMFFPGLKAYFESVNKSRNETIVVNKSQSVAGAFYKAFVGNSLKTLGLNEHQDDVMFVPAGRAFYSNLQTHAFTFLAGNDTLDPFLVHFGAMYDTIRSRIKNNSQIRISKSFVKSILDVKHVMKDSGEYVITRDNRFVSLLSASSGQQELIPLLEFFDYEMEREYLRSKPKMRSSIYFVEEPETHLFPESQNQMAKCFSTVFNNMKKTYPKSIFITTHSPYFLTAINNLLMAGKIYDESDSHKQRTKAENIIPKNMMLHPDEFKAYFMSESGCSSVVDPETGLIDGKMLDSASSINGIEFNQLMEIE